MSTDRLEPLDRTECYTLLRSRSLGRVGVMHGDDPVILPVFYAVLDDDVVFRTAPGTKLDAAVMGVRVVFEIDSPSPPWSVLVVGHAHEVRDHADQVRARAHLGHDWPAGEREHLVRISADRVTGRRVRPS